MIFLKVHVLKMLMKLNKILTIQEIFIDGKYPKNSKTVRDLQKSLFIQKMIMHFKKCFQLKKYLLNKKNVREFKKLFQ